MNYRGNILSRVSSDSEADASESQENFEKILVVVSEVRKK